MPRLGEYGGALLTNGIARNCKWLHAAIVNGSRSSPTGCHCKPPFQCLSMVNNGKPLLRSS
ncbi:hypothetical protein FQZ97_1118630 [compost metagenome]